MAISRENKKLLLVGEFFVAHTWRCLLRSLLLFFPAILFLLLGYFMFWHVTQGKDLMVITIEDPKGKSTMAEFFCFVIALLFWVYVTWYSTRLVAKAKHFQNPDDTDSVWEIFRVQAPRVLAFTCITVVLLAFFQLENYNYPHLDFWICIALLFLSYGWYYFIYRFWTKFLGQKTRDKDNWVRLLHRVRGMAYLVLACWTIGVVLVKSFWSIITLLLILQIGLVLLLIVRRELDETQAKKTDNPKHINHHSKFWKKVKYIILHDENPNYVRVFMIICTIGLAFYITSIISIEFAVFIGPFPFVFLAFGVLLGFGNMLSYLSVLIRFNCHLVLFVISLIFGSIFDSHRLHLPDKKEDQPKFSQRQNLKEYFTAWLNDSTRSKYLSDSSAGKYPVYFVMANGGASRSGYWTAKILGGLEDSTEGKFSEHLFCLSGASGGSVGNATFFSLLRAKDSMTKYHKSVAKVATDYLRSDFLTFTLSHLLGPDIFRNFLPFFNWIEMDRGRALAYSLEKAPSRHCFLYDSFKVTLSSLITQKNTPYHLPVLCINTTRMRDGNPAVISNIRIREDNIRYNYFNNRVDVLDLLGEERDIKLSTAVVLGASFPYISPAGRIDKVIRVKDTTTGAETIVSEPYYFVDGGYFDNSGAGVVNEMIVAMNGLLNTDSALMKYKSKLEFFVIHISNTDPKLVGKKPINSMTNDLLAPAKTLLGSYGAQTTVNDQRLKSYLFGLYNDIEHYNQIDLYDKSTLPKFRYSMNWVISDKHRSRMDSALNKNDEYKKEVERMMRWKY